MPATNPPKRELKFCKTCNTRDRIIVDGRCSVCGNYPHDKPGSNLLPATNPLPSMSDVLIWALLTLTILYLFGQVVRMVLSWN